MGRRSTSSKPRASLSRAALTAAIAASVASACGIAFTTRADWPWIWLAWVVLVPWLLVLERAGSIRHALGAGWLMSVAFVAIVFSWLPRMIAGYTGASWPVALGLALAAAPILEPQVVTFALARHLARTALARSGSSYGWIAPLAGAAVYIGTEWVWPKVFTDTLGHVLHASPWIRQAADLSGAHGLTFALLAGNECVLAMLQGFGIGERQTEPPARGPFAAVIALVLLIASLSVYGSHRLAEVDRERQRAGASLTVAAVQTNLAHYDRVRQEIGTFETVRLILDAHFALSREALRELRPDLLVWPETVYPTTFGTPKSADGEAFDREIAGFVRESRVPLLFGTYAAEAGAEFNAAVLLEPRPEGAIPALSTRSYRKRRLFPFTETLPPVLESERIRRWMPWAGTWKVGSGADVLDVDTPVGRRARIAPLICYDALDPALAIAAARQGAELLVTLSNDSWFAFPGVQRLILIISAFRSVETRRPQLRSTPTGISAVIDEAGTILDSVGVDQRGILVARMPLGPPTGTLMLAWGNWLPPVALIVASALLLAARLAGRAGDARR